MLPNNNMKKLKFFWEIPVVIIFAGAFILSSAYFTSALDYFYVEDENGNPMCYGNAQSFETGPGDIPGGCDGDIYYDCTGASWNYDPGSPEYNNFCDPVSPNAGWCYTDPQDPSACEGGGGGDGGGGPTYA